MRRQLIAAANAVDNISAEQADTAMRRIANFSTEELDDAVEHTAQQMADDIDERVLRSFGPEENIESLHSVEYFPTHPPAGTMCYSYLTRQLYVYNGAEWVMCDG